jgi:hypothetical protein
VAPYLGCLVRLSRLRSSRSVSTPAALPRRINASNCNRVTSRSVVVTSSSSPTSASRRITPQEGARTGSFRGPPSLPSVHRKQPRFKRGLDRTSGPKQGTSQCRTRRASACAIPLPYRFGAKRISDVHAPDAAAATARVFKNGLSK